ncbi:MAG: ABC transporter ATP-binding protein [Oscillospiraceae bacterium]|nr:ABC transporter ATP-binding protein [Oscillospiraceae bacterium]
MPYIEFENVNKYFGTNHVLKDISIGIEKGSLVTLLGPSGCGKSTLLRCLAGLEEINDGKIYLDGKDVTNVPARKRNVGMVFQQYSLFPNMNVYQNVAFGLKIAKVDKKEIDTKVSEMLEIIGLPEKKGSYPNELSGGQQQRVALARALVTSPKVLLLDEPLSAIDALLRHNLQIEIRRIHKAAGITTIFVTHDQDEAMVMSDQIFLLKDGVVEQAGDPIHLYSRPRTKFAATFIGHYNIYKAEDFQKATGFDAEAEMLALRPEIVEVSRTRPETDGSKVVFPGEVVSSIAHGNIIRYTIGCGDIKMDVDILFAFDNLYEIGEKVFLSVKNEDVLCLE